MKRLFSFGPIIAAFFTVSLHGAPEKGAAEPDPIIGKWAYHGDDIVTFKPDGVASSKQGGAGAWRYLKNPEAERKYEITWHEGLYIDTIRMTRDRQKLEGKNQKGRRIDATRLPDPTK